MEDKLDLRAEKAIRNYLAKLFVIPSVVLTVAAFFLGYFINTTAHKEAKIDAYEKFQDAQTKADDKFRSMIANLYDEIDQTRKKILKSEIDISGSVNNTNKLLESAETLQKKVASLDAIIKAGNISSSIANDPSFRSSVVGQLKAEFKQEIISGQDGYCTLTDTYQLCWGSKLLDSKASKHVRDFSFKFPLKFKNIPVVTNGINANSSGWAFSVYRHNIDLETYSGSIVEHTSRNSVTPVTMNYIAIAQQK